MSLLQHLHPATIHFPIALLLLGSVLALYYLWRPGLVQVRWAAWLLLALGWVGGMAAVLTGLFAQSNLPPDAPYRDVLNWHIGVGLAQLVIYGFVLYQGWLFHAPRRQKQRAARGDLTTDLLDSQAARVWLTALLLLGMLLVAATGWNGGVLVYEWGVNVGG
jgi:uncharacterized membrane protein